MVSPPPIIANSGNVSNKIGLIVDERPTKSATTRPAPALIPNMPESARGFRVNVCNKSPAKAREAPPIIEANILGKRILQMIRRVEELARPLTTSITSEKDELAYPIDKEMRKPAERRMKRNEKILR